MSESVAELKGEEPQALLDLKIDLLVDAYLPHDYVDSEELRLDAYRKLALVTNDDDLAALRDEWIDRFGPLPAQAAALLRIGALRVACHAAGLSRVVVADASVRLSPARLDKEAQRRAESISRCSYDNETQVLRIDVPRDEGAVEFLVRVLPLIFADN